MAMISADSKFNNVSIIKNKQHFKFLKFVCEIFVVYSGILDMNGSVKKNQKKKELMVV